MRGNLVFDVCIVHDAQIFGETTQIRLQGMCPSTFAVVLAYAEIAHTTRPPVYLPRAGDAHVQGISPRNPLLIEEALG